MALEPTVRTGALIGYARVSTSGQLLDRPQLRTLRQQRPAAPAGAAAGTACGYGMYGVWYAIGVTETWCR